MPGFILQESTRVWSIYLCLAESGCSDIESNIASIWFLEAENEIHPLLPDSVLMRYWWEATGNTEWFETLTEVTYLWQINDSINHSTTNWMDYSNPTQTTDSTMILLTTGNSNDFGLRRIVSFDGCSDTSTIDTVIMGEVQSSSNATSFCLMTGSYDFNIGRTYTYDSSFHFKVQWDSKNHGATTTDSCWIQPTTRERCT